MEINGVSGGGREKCVKRLTKRIITLFRLTPRLLGALRGKERGLSPIDFFFSFFFFLLFAFASPTTDGNGSTCPLESPRWANSSGQFARSFLSCRTIRCGMNRSTQ